MAAQQPSNTHSQILSKRGGMYLMPPPGCCCAQPPAHSSSWNTLPTLDWHPQLCQVLAVLPEDPEVAQEITGTLLRGWPCPAQRNARAVWGHPYRKALREKNKFSLGEKETFLLLFSCFVLHKRYSKQRNLVPEGSAVLLDSHGISTQQLPRKGNTLGKVHSGTRQPSRAGSAAGICSQKELQPSQDQ